MNVLRCHLLRVGTVAAAVGRRVRAVLWFLVGFKDAVETFVFFASSFALLLLMEDIAPFVCEVLRDAMLATTFSLVGAGYDAPGPRLLCVHDGHGAVHPLAVVRRANALQPAQPAAQRLPLAVLRQRGRGDH